MKILRSAVLALVLCSAAPNAFAIAVNFSFEGTVDFAGPDNLWGLAVGDKITVSGMFDDVLTGTGVESVSFGAGTGNMMEIIAGLITYNETDDLNFLTGFPMLSFNDGVLSEFAFAVLGGGTIRGLTGLRYESDSAGTTRLRGQWSSDTFTKSPKALPEPGTLGLAMIALAGLGLSRKRKQR